MNHDPGKEREKKNQRQYPNVHFLLGRTGSHYFPYKRSHGNLLKDESQYRASAKSNRGGTYLVRAKLQKHDT